MSILPETGSAMGRPLTALPITFYHSRRWNRAESQLNAVIIGGFSVEMIHRERIKALNTKGVKKGAYVLYWMQASQRAEYNQALEYALAQATGGGRRASGFLGSRRPFPGATKAH